jgi:cytoskeletal protein RodZ
MQEETRTEVTTETSQPGVEINPATPEVEIPVQPETTTEIHTTTTNHKIRNNTHNTTVQT